MILSKGEYIFWLYDFQNHTARNLPNKKSRKSWCYPTTQMVTPASENMPMIKNGLGPDITKKQDYLSLFMIDKSTISFRSNRTN